jgi:hypothetical protein
MSSEPDSLSTAPLIVGSVVCVRDRYLGNWIGGFVVAEVLPRGYRLRRVSDRHVIDEVFGSDEVMAERRVDPLHGMGHFRLTRRGIR